MVDPHEIDRKIGELAAFSSSSTELTRQTYSAAWEQAASWVIAELERLGMEWRMDGIGNIVGRYDPGHSSLAPIAIGSHLDTVINGGAYDGALGIIAGLEAVGTLAREGIPVARPIEVIAFAEEEGGVFGKGCLGSEYLTGHFPLDRIASLIDREGVSVRERAAACRIEKSILGADYGWGRGRYRAFFEIHAEQGPVLEEKGKPVGIVEGVVGIYRREAKFVSAPDHAGTTPMSKRRDAAVAMAAYVVKAYEYGRTHDGEIVVTNGRLSVKPNQQNVVPGFAAAMTEIRSDTDEKIQKAAADLKEEASRIAARYGMKAQFSEPAYVPPVSFDADLIRLADSVRPRGEVPHLFSWAGHDAKLMSTVAPSLMLFVPSRGGISHSPLEYSDGAAIAAATEHLIEMVNKL